ncbi:unnamed protein product [Penicillium salamii]|uniref:MARVEL domain-containing protein n=1 Tax=Penicillium salamii TaxID=1612424 RepID=A0A9W4JSI6_9EURO|nr:unnamed protein product [Penicillium salamii]CAG8300776.1 unnamed protein product [Penicillium salamii]CAG8353899.1 unnamed protein product [Penicillium salamii]CAG8359834.1 unnamed protein product [Penicillium salamii]CAG8367726.1 unnamed protein product [Penicillium salamii]
MRSSVKPSAYPPLPFHLIRFFIFLSSLVVGVILAVFIYHLHADGFKLPYSFIVLLVSAALSLANLILTSIINCTCSLSTKLAIALNIILTILWALSLALMSWSMAGSITTSCTTAVWGNTAGITVCRSYKAMFTFTVTGLISHIAAIWLDVVVRRRETRFGNYGAMGSQPGLDDSGAFDAKMDDRRDDTPLQDFHDLPNTHGNYGNAYGNQGYDYQHGAHERDYDAQYHDHENGGRQRVRFGSQDQVYQRPAEQTGYDPAMYR